MEKRHKILEIEEMHTYYGDSHIIQGLSMHVFEQEAVSIIGRNDAGKTTTLRSIIGLTPPRSGNIFIDGQQTTRWQPHKVSRLGVAYLPAERHIFPGLSVEETLRLAARPGSGENAWTYEKVCIQSGITLLIVEQNYQMALKVASRHYFMDTRGKIVNNLTTRELEDNSEIIQSHLSV